jgi:signal transduction histidine kinase
MANQTRQPDLAAFRALQERDYQELKAALEAIRRDLHDLRDSLLGNGQQGVLTRLAILEHDSRKRGRIALAFYGAVVALVTQAVWSFIAA